MTDIKAHFEEIIDRVSKGEKFTVTRYGRPVAGLIPPDSPAKTPAGKRKDARVRKGKAAR